MCFPPGQPTASKWAWPVRPKKDVPLLVENLLAQLANQHGVTPKNIHCGSGTEFLNDAIRSILHTRGITLTYAATKANEQNGITERNVRTVTKRMRALRL